jgi:hypothetical protein
MSDAMAVCYACKRVIGDRLLEPVDDSLCYGCGEYFCDHPDCAADDLIVPFGRHSPEDHLADPS